MDKCLVTKLVQSVNDSSLPKLGDCVFELLGDTGRFNVSTEGAVVRVLSGSITYDGTSYSAGQTFTAYNEVLSGTSGSMFAVENKYEGLRSILAAGSWRLVNASDLTYVIKQTTGLKNQFTVDELMKLSTVGTSSVAVFGVQGVEPFIPNFADIANIRARYIQNYGTNSTLFSGVSTWSSTSLRNTEGTKGLFTRNCLFASGTDIDNYLINQAACTGGITFISGYKTISLTTQDGTGRTSASDDAVAAIKVAGGTLTINGVEQ